MKEHLKGKVALVAGALAAMVGAGPPLSHRRRRDAETKEAKRRRATRPLSAEDRKPNTPTSCPCGGGPWHGREWCDDYAHLLERRRLQRIARRKQKRHHRRKNHGVGR